MSWAQSLQKHCIRAFARVVSVRRSKRKTAAALVREKEFVLARQSRNHEPWAFGYDSSGALQTSIDCESDYTVKGLHSRDKRMDINASFFPWEALIALIFRTSFTVATT